MLRGIHKASANWIGRAVMGVILGLIAVSFGIWGIGDIFRGFGTSTLAKVGGTEIRIETFRQLYQDRLQQLGRQIGRPILPDQARALGLDRQLLNQVIGDAVLDERARAMRLGLSDAEVARQVMDSPAFKGITGQFDRARFEATIRNNGYSEARFFAEERRNMVRQQLIGTIGGEAVVPKAALELFNRFQNEERTIDYVTLGPEHAGDVPQPSAEELAKFFEARKAAFRAPEYRRLTLVVLTADDIASTIEISDDDLKKAYEARKARFETPERRHLKQIVFPNLGEAQAAVEKLKQGTTFEAIATERGLKDSDTDLGTVAQSAVVDRDVADVAFKLQQGETSGPIEGRLGIAIVKVETIEPGRTQPFEQVAAELKRDLQLERARNEVTNVQEKVEDERLGGATLADAARKFNLKPREILAIDRDGKDPSGKEVPDLPKGVDVLAAAFNADVQGDNEPMRLPGNAGYVWFNVEEVKPSHDRSLDEVKDEVAARWRSDEIASRLKTKATELLDKIKAGTAFGELMAAQGLKVEWKPGLKRNNPPPGIAPAALVEIFRTPLEGVATTDGASPTERLVFRVTEVKVPPLDPEAGETKRIAEALKSRAADDLNTQFVIQLQNEVGVTINQNALSQVSGGSQQNY